jgi:hypothetical protein
MKIKIPTFNVPDNMQPVAGNIVSLFDVFNINFIRSDLLQHSFKLPLLLALRKGRLTANQD